MKQKIVQGANDLIDCFVKQGIESIDDIANMIVDKSKGSIYTSKKGYYVLFEKKESFKKTQSNFVTVFRDEKPVIEISVNTELDFIRFTFISDTIFEGYTVQASNDKLKVIYKEIKGCTFENVKKELIKLSKK